MLTPAPMPLTPPSADASPTTASLHGLDGVNFFLAGVLAGFGPYVAVYLADQKWTQEKIGFVLSASALAGLLSQVPGGELLDNIRSKRVIVALGVLVVALSAMIIEFRPDFSLVLIALMLQGVTGGTGPPAGEDKQRLRLRPRSRELGGACKPLPLLGSIAQNIFQGDVEIAPHLGHALIAILTKERRWLIIFKDSPASLVLKQNDPQRRVECSGELMAGHL